MPNSEFERLKYIKLNSFFLDCPIDTEKGALVLDRKRDRVLLQLKLVNISEYRVSSIHAIVESFDNAKDSISGIGPVVHDYLDLKLDSGGNTGEKNPVILDKIVREVKVSIDKVVFESGDIWRSEEKETYEKPEQDSLKTLGSERLEHLGYILKNNGIDNSKLEYYPIIQEGIWICSCGRPNNSSTNECVRCHVDKEQIFDLIYSNNLDNSLKSHKAELQMQLEIKEKNKKKLIDAEEKIKKEREEENLNISEKRIKRNKRLSIISLILLFVSLGAYFIVINSTGYKYNQAKSLMEQQKYSDAIEIYDNLGNFKDSQVLAAVAQAGIEYEEAINIFKTNNVYHAYRIIDEMDHEFITDKAISKTVLQVGLELFEHKSFTKAKKYFDAVNTSLNTDEFMNSKYFQIEGRWKDIETNDIIEIKLLEENKLSLDESWARWQINEDYVFQVGSTSEKFIVREAGSDELKLSIIYGYRKGTTFRYTRIK